MLWSQFFILTKASWRILAIKGGMSIFHLLRVFSIGHDFFSKLDSTFPSFASNISVVLVSFTLNFEYVVAETKSYFKCTLYFVSIFCWISPPILVPNKYYKSSLFFLFRPTFCVQDNLKMAQSNILKFGTHMYRHMHKTQHIFRP